MKNTKDFASLPYTVVLRRDDEGEYVARVEELPGCVAHGANPVEALACLDEAKEAWIQDCIESGDPVPIPERHEALPSGKWLQRVPRSLHKRLAALARREGVSLNQLVTAILGEAVGARTRPDAEHEEAWKQVWAHAHVLQEEGSGMWVLKQPWSAGARNLQSLDFLLRTAANPPGRSTMKGLSDAEKEKRSHNFTH